MNADDSNGARFHVGSTIAGRYRVERPIGEGAMGAVALARHVSLDETVAIKFLRPELRRDPVATARLAREAKALARIKSDHVARVLDVGITLSVGPYMVMEYLEGVDLGEVLETEGPLPVPRVVECMLQVCEALTVAHTAGITHRDIKPQNLFLARHGRFETLKILDFGIAEDAPNSAAAGDLVFPTEPLSSRELLPSDEPLSSREPLSSHEPLSSRGSMSSAEAWGPSSSQSSSGSDTSSRPGPVSSSTSPVRASSPVYGTPSYMAPERVRNDPDADHRSDIWSVGVVLHELVTGRAVFDADTITETCARILSDEPIPLEQNDAALPPSLRAIIARCLERDPAQRYQSVEELAAALAPLATMHERFRGRSTGAFSRRLIEEELAHRQGPASQRGADPTASSAALAGAAGPGAAPPGTWQHAAAGVQAWAAGLWETRLPRYLGFAVASVALAAIGIALVDARWMTPPPIGVPIRAEPVTRAREDGRGSIVESVLPLATPGDISTDGSAATSSPATSSPATSSPATSSPATSSTTTSSGPTPAANGVEPSAATPSSNADARSAGEGSTSTRPAAARARSASVRRAPASSESARQEDAATGSAANEGARASNARSRVRLVRDRQDGKERRDARDRQELTDPPEPRDEPAKKERPKKTRSVPPWLQPYQSNPAAGAKP